MERILSDIASEKLPVGRLLRAAFSVADSTLDARTSVAPRIQSDTDLSKLEALPHATSVGIVIGQEILAANGRFF